MSGFARGFSTGFGLVDNYERQNFQQERQLKADARAEELHGLQVQGVKNNLELFPMQKEAAELSVQNQKLGIDAAQFKVDTQQQTHDLDVKAKKASIYASNLAARNNLFELNRKSSLQLIDQIGMSNGEMNGKLIEEVIKSSKQEGSLLYQFGPDLEQGYAINEGIDKILKGDMSVEEGMPYITQWLQGSANKVVGHEDDEGRTVVSAKVVGLKNATTKDGKMGGTPILRVEYDDGTVEDEPATEFRVTRAGEPEVVISMDQVYQTHFAERSVLSVLKATGIYDKVKKGVNQHYSAYRPSSMPELTKMTANHFIKEFEALNEASRGTVQDGVFVPADPAAVAAQQKTVDRMASTNPQLAMQFGWTPPPAPAQLVKFAKTRTFESEEERQEFIRGVSLGHLDPRQAQDFLLRHTTEKKAIQPATDPAPKAPAFDYDAMLKKAYSTEQGTDH